MKNKAPKSGNTSGCIILFIAVFIIFPIFYFAVKSTPPTPPQPSEKTQEKTEKIMFPADSKIKVKLNFWAYANKKDRAIIHGETNLPPGTNLIFTVQSNKRIYGQEKSTVAADGSFQSQELGPQNGLPEGIYTANVTMPVMLTQPEAVRQRLGQNGENLSGRLIKKNGNQIYISENKDFLIQK